MRRPPFAGATRQSPDAVVAAVVFLIHVCSKISLQDDWTKALTDQSTDGDLALLQVSINRRAGEAALHVSPPCGFRFDQARLLCLGGASSLFWDKPLPEHWLELRVLRNP